MKNRIFNKRVLSFLLTLLMIVGVFPAGAFAVSAEDDIATVADGDELYVNCDYNSSTEGYGTTKFSNYAGAYSYATTNGKTKATIVIEKTNTLSGNTFDNNHKNYSRLAVVIKDGATMGNAASKWDMTYPVTVEPGGTLTCARPASASVSNIHIKNTLTVGAAGAEKKAVVDFLSDTYQDCDISIRYNGKVIVNNADFRVQDLDAQGALTISDSDVYVDGAFASATFYATTLTNSIVTVKGNQISGGLSDFAGGTSNQLGNVKITNSTLTIEEGSTKVAANVTVSGNSIVSVADLTVNSSKKITVNDTAKVVATGTLTNNGTIAAATSATVKAANVNEDSTGKVTIDGKDASPNAEGNFAIPVAEIGEQKYTSLEVAFAAATGDQTITLLADATPALTSQRAITKAAVIDLNGKTLTLTEDDLYFGTTTFKDGTIVVDPSVKPSTAVFWMFKDQTLTFDNVKLVATGVTGTYLIGLDGNNADLNILNGSEIVVENTTALDLDIICVNASTGNDILVENSKVNVTNLDGRVFFRGNYTISGSSEIALEGITKAGFRIEAGQTLSIEDDASVTIKGNPRDGGIHLTDLTATYTKADTATVIVETVKAPTYEATINGVKYATIAEAIAASNDGDTVVICAGEFAPINISNKNITIQGSVGANGELLTTIKGGNPAITGHGFNGTIKDLKIVDAFKVMYAEPAGNVTIDNVYVTGATYGFHLVAYSTDLTWTIQNSYMDLSWANSFGVYGGDAAIVIKGNVFESTSPYYPNYGALPVNTFLPNVTVEGNVFGENAKIYIDKSVTDTSKINISKNYHADGVDKAFADDADGVKVAITQYYTGVDSDGKPTGLVDARPEINGVKYDTLEEAFAAAAAGDTIVLLADATPALTSQRAITKAAVIDLGGKTLTLKEDDLYFGTTTFKNGTIVVDPSVKPSTAVFWMFADQTLTFDNVKIVATGVTGTYLIGLDGNNSDLNIINGSEIVVNNETALDLDIICVNASTGNDILVKDSKVNVTNLDGRVFFRGNYTISGSSEIALEGITKAGFRIEAGQTLSIEDDASVTIKGNPRDGGIHLTDLTATYTKADTATVIVETVNAPAYEATINGVKYATLQAAINAVKNGETIVLVSDVAENVTLTEKTGLYYTIDGAGKTMNGTITINSLSDTNDNRRITIKNINFVDTDVANVDFISSVNTNHYPRITVEGCTFTGSGNDGDVAIRLKSSHSVVIKDCTGTGLHSFLQNTSGWNLTIENVTVTDSKGGLALGTVQGVTVKGCNITVDGYGVRMDAQYNNNAVIESNTVKAFIPVVVRKANAESNITFQGTNAMTASNTDGLWCAIGTSEYEINGTMPTEATGKVIVKLNDTGLEAAGVYGNYGVASVSDVKYATLAEAVAAAQAGDTIKLLADITLTETLAIPAGKTITLDLNGKTISQSKACTESYAMIENNGNLTITGNGKISFTDTSEGDPSFGWGSYTIRNEGTLVVKNGTIEHLGAQAFATHMICAIFQYSGSTTINSGTISTPSYRSVRLWKGDMTINGGIFDGQIWVQAVDNSAKLTINGGTFEPNGNDASSVFVSNATYDVEFAVTDGTFNGKIGANNADKLVGVISGGKFNAAAVAGTNVVLLAEGLIFSDEIGADGYYTTVYGLRGAGTETDPYLINNKEDLLWFQAKVDEQAADGSTQFAGKYFKLTADINLAGINWNPIGSKTGDHGSFKGVFDGAGHTISNLYVEQAGEGLGLFAYTSGNAVIKNLNLVNVTVKSTNNSSYVGGLVGNAYASTKIENVHISGDVLISGRGYIGGIAGHGYVVMDNVSVNANEGGLITSTFWCAGGILGYAGEGVTNITNAHVEGLTVTSAAGGLGAIVGMAEDNNGTQPISGSNLSAENVVVKTYIGGYGTAYEDYAIGYLYGGNPTSKLTGTLKVENVTLTTASGNAASVVDAVATVNGSVYFDLQTALEAGGEVKILRDIILTKTLVVPAGKTVTLDLNGKTITTTITEKLTKSFAMFTNKGNFTVIDSGNDIEGGINGKISLNYTADSFGYGIGLYVISNEGGTLTVNGGRIENLTTVSGSMYDAIDNNSTLGNTYLTINGGEIYCAYLGIRQFANSTTFENVVTINGGKVEGGNSAIWIQNPGSAQPKANVVITKGDIEGRILAGESTEFAVAVSGGTFTVAVPEEFCADGFIPTKNSDGTYGVKAGKYVARIDGVGYETIADAINAAQAGETVTILAGNYTTDISVNKAITVVGETDDQGNNLVNITGRVSVSTGATVKNLNVHNEKTGNYDCALSINGKDIVIDGVKLTGYNGLRNCYAKGDVTIKNSTINGSFFALHFDGSDGGNLMIENCDITGWVSYGGGIDNVTLKDSTFDAGSYAGQRSYAENLVIEGSTFKAGYKLDIAVENSTVTVTNTQMYDGSNVIELFNKEDAVSNNVTIDNEKVTYVAKIGNAYYATLEEALAKVTDWTTIKLVANATLDYGAREAYGRDTTTDIIIDGQGFTLTLNQTNSDWSSIGMKNANGKLTLKNMTIEKTGYGDTSGAWNTHAIIFSCNVEMNNVTVNNSVAVQNGATLNNVTINEANGFYGLWINGNGQTVTMNGGEINATNGGRGIKIADQYINAPAIVNLTVDGTKFATAKKAAVLVSSTAGAKITASNVDITNVAADNANFVWVDEDWAANYGKVTVNDAPAAQENLAAFNAAIVDGDKVVGYYNTLEAVIAAANAGETITLLADIEATAVILIDKSITINGNGHKVTSSATRVFRVTTANVEVTLNEVNMVSTAVRVGTNDVRGISIDSVESVELTLNNCSVDFTDASANDWAYAVNVTGGSNHTLTVNGGTYEGANVINVRGTNNTIVVKNATLTSTYPNNDQYYGACIYVVQDNGSSVSATGNTFKGTNAVAFNVGYTPVTESNNTDNTTKVVAKIGDTYYTSLAKAFEAAQIGDIVNLLQNVELSETIKVNTNVTLNLNGKTIIGTDNATKSFALFEIQPGKEFTVEGDGKITLTATNNRGWNAYSSVISNQRGKLTVNGGTIEHLGGTDMAYAIDNLTNGKGTYAETVINGGTVKSPYRAIRQFLNGTEAQNILTVNGGTIEGTNKAIWMQGANTSANNGALTVKAAAQINGNIYLDTADGTTVWPVAISVAASALSNGSTIIKDDNIPAKYLLTENNGTYSIEIGLVGSGTEADPYLINDVDDLIFFRDSVNAGETKYNAPGVVVALAANIDMAGATWERGIGDGINATFDGIFDGNNKTIKNLNFAPKADSDGYLCGGLFGYTYGAAVIKNLVLEHITVTTTDAGHNVGALVGFANNNGGKLTVSNVIVRNVIIDAPNAYGVGAIVGYSYRAMGTIENCTVNGATITGYSFVGGITGYSYSNAVITNCSVANATITATSKGAGGIAGLALDGNKITENTVADTTVTAPTNWGYVVGELGASSAEISKNTAAEPQIGGDYETGEAYQTKIGNKYYTSIAAAIEAAQAGETVTLVSDVKEPMAMVALVKGITLDLNGHNLEAGYLVAFNGNHVVDNATEKGLLKIDKNKISLAKDNRMMPVYNEQDGYLFVEPIAVIPTKNVGENTHLTFKYNFGTEINSLFKNGMLDNGLSIVIRLTWTVADGERKQEFIYSEEFVKTVYGTKQGFTFKSTGLTAYQNMTIELLIISDTEVEKCMATYTVPYSNPNSNTNGSENAEGNNK